MTPIAGTLLAQRPAASHHPPWKRRFALLALTAGTFLYVTTETLPVGLIDPISHDLGVSGSDTGLLVTYYGLVVIAASVPLTHLTRRIPRRRLLSALFAVFVVSALTSAAASSYATLLATRVVTALSQALFWSIVVPIAAGLFGEKVRGRVVALVLGGGALAGVAGVPLGTWAGQQFSWRGVFVGLAVLGLLAWVVVAVCLPPAGEATSTAERGGEPDRRRFWVLVAMTVLGSAGAFVFFTYISPYLTKTAALPAGLLGVVLMVRGFGGVLGVAVAGRLVERHPRFALVLPLWLQSAALIVLFWQPGATALVIVMVTLTGFAFTGFTTPLAARVMVLAPGRVDLAVSAISTGVNVGITLGALLGSVILAGPGAGTTALAGGLLTTGALALTYLDRPSRTSAATST